jgi:hypothetical protein
MNKINYSPYDEKSDKIPDEIMKLIKSKNPYFADEIKHSKVKIRQVQSPFILADNIFDLSEANNDLYEIGVKRTKTVEFTGGSMYIEFVKDGEGIIVHGNEEEGYNIFIMNVPPYTDLLQLLYK